MFKSDQAYSLIALSIESSLQIHISSLTTPREAWNELKEHFEFVSVTQIVRLYKRFYSARLEENGDMMKHITEMTEMAEQLKEMHEEVSSKKFAIVILGSLPDSYDNFLTSMNARSADDLDWGTVKSLLMEEHLKRQDKEKRKVEDEALFSSGNNFRNNRGGLSGRSRGGGSSRGGRRGGRHNNSHPYSNNNRYREQRTCYSCQQPGHIAKVCFIIMCTK